MRVHTQLISTEAANTIFLQSLFGFLVRAMVGRGIAVDALQDQMLVAAGVSATPANGKRPKAARGRKPKTAGAAA